MLGLGQSCPFFRQTLSLDMQIWNHRENIIFIACKWCKLCKYYVNSMVILCDTCQQKKNYALGLNMWYMQSCCDFNFCNLNIFPPNPESQIFRIDKKMLIPTLDWSFHIILNRVKIDIGYDIGYVHASMSLLSRVISLYIAPVVLVLDVPKI